MRRKFSSFIFHISLWSISHFMIDFRRVWHLRYEKSCLKSLQKCNEVAIFHFHRSTQCFYHVRLNPMMSFNQCQITFLFVLSHTEPFSLVIISRKISSNCSRKVLTASGVKFVKCIAEKGKTKTMEMKILFGHLSVKSDCARGRCMKHICRLRWRNKIDNLLLFWTFKRLWTTETDWKLMQLKREINFR